LIVFDIETVPLEEATLSKNQLGYIQKKLDSAKLRNPALDEAAERSKIRGTDAYLSRIVCIGLYYPQTGQQIALTNESEKAILESFWAAIGRDNGLYISYNGIRFDVPFILKRSIVHGINPTSNAFLQYTKYNPCPPHFDVMVQIGGRDSNYALKEMCDLFSVPSPKEGAVTGESVAQAYKEGRITEIAEYCLRDVVSTYQLYTKIKPFVLISNTNY
jgi:3'-5' exonuclease